MTSISERAAAEFADMRIAMRVIDQLDAAAAPNTLAAAYACQDLLVRRLTEHFGGAPVGYKVACTNQLARDQLNVPHPLFGTLLSHSTHVAPVTLSAAHFTKRTIEPEFGFQFAADVPPPSTGAPYTVETIMPFVGAAFPSIEIVDHRFADWTRVGAFGIAGDNAIHGAWVHGDAVTDWRAIDFAAHRVALYADGAMVREGTGAVVLNGPLNVLAWLANTAPVYDRRLRKGDYVTTGVVCDVYPAERGQTLLADFGAMGSVELRFD
jgi:2-keto-4-pentenoate hydratase